MPQNILFAVAFCAAVSCKSKIDLPGKQPPVATSIAPHPSQMLLLGKTIKITYETYGCFHYGMTTVFIQETDGKYMASVDYQDPSNSIKATQMDSSFSHALRDFKIFYAGVLNSKRYKPKINNSSFGTIQKMRIEGGLNTAQFFCDTPADLAGFFALVKNIERQISNTEP